RENNNRAHTVIEWLDVRNVVSDDTRTATWLSFGFLLVCLVNTAGLLLAKFSGRPGEIGVRRALGASRREIFSQYLAEAGGFALGGARAGAALPRAPLSWVREFDTRVELGRRLDIPPLAVAIFLAVLTALAAGLLPTWRACQVVPALQLKRQ